MEKLLSEIKRQLLILELQEEKTRYTEIDVIEVVQKALTEQGIRNESVALRDLDNKDNGSSTQTTTSTQQSIYSKPITEAGIYNVEDIRKTLGIGKRQAYSLANSGVFPIIRIGRRIVVSKQRFWEWANSIDPQGI